MFIFEEYLTRHSFDVVYAKHTLNSSLFFRHNNQWRILTIRWAEQGSHPGLYSIRSLEPVGNQYDKKGEHPGHTGITLRRTANDAHVHWEEYEKYLIEWSSKLSFANIAHNTSESKIAAWEICLYCFDALLISYANNENFYNTVNLDIPIGQRAAAVDLVLRQIKRDERHHIREPIINFWENEVNSYIHSHCDWLVKMVERYGRKI